MENEAIAGIDSGSTRRVNIIQGVAPSAWADSRIDFGMPEI